MERIIKFRGIRADNGEWVYGYYAYKIETNKSYVLVETIGNNCSSYFTEYEVIPETVGQYTGLKDKNGEEIYEGDILKSRNGIDLILIRAVKAGFMPFRKRYGIFNKQTNWANVESGEIISNIFENPELLEGRTT